VFGRLAKDNRRKGTTTVTAKKLPVVKAAQREAAARASEMAGEATLDLADVVGAIREGLLALSCTAGLVVMRQMMENELTAKIGPKGRHDAGRTATRHGRAQGSVVLGGRRVPLDRPRARAHHGEVTLDTWTTFSADDLLSQLVVERMLAGVATRRHREVSEPIGAELETKSRSTSRSAVSRRFKAATETALAELLARDLSDVDVAVLMIDGIVFADCCCVVALAITADGTKVPVGLWDGDTENATVVKDLLADLVARGLRHDRGILVVIDGSKALAAGVRRVFGDKALVQRCTLHKRRNVGDYLPDELASTIDRRLAQAFNDTDADRGLRVAQGIARQLEDRHPSAAASLREGLEQMFTVRRLGVGDRLARSLACTNAIESMISVVRGLTDRVKRWKDTKMVRRWVGVGMLEAERSFRRIKGCKDMPTLVAAIRKQVGVVPAEYDQAA
jgi:putative transposase